MQEPDLTDLSVIIVDDQRDFLRLFCAILRSFGVRKLVYCQRAEEVLQHMRGVRFDMLFTDVRMPEVDGIELIRRVRSNEKLLCRGLPIICVSAFSEQSAIRAAIRAGADDFLVKPVRPIDVYKRLSSHLRSPLPRIKEPGYFGPDPRRAAGSASDRYVDPSFDRPSAKRPEQSIARDAEGIQETAIEFLSVAENAGSPGARKASAETAQSEPTSGRRRTVAA